MSDAEGTYTRLAEIAKQKITSKPPPPAPDARASVQKDSSPPQEDLSTTPYISQNYRFTEDELKWLRRQAYSLTERFGTKVSQNTILRIALHTLREACRRSPKRNPVTDAVSQLKK